MEHGMDLLLESERRSLPGWLGNTGRAIGFPAGKGPGDEDCERNKAPAQADDDASIDYSSPGLGQVVDDDHQDRDAEGEAVGDDLSPAIGVKVAHDKEGCEKRVEKVGRGDEVVRAGGCTRREALLESLVALTVGHEDNPPGHRGPLDNPETAPEGLKGAEGEAPDCASNEGEGAECGPQGPKDSDHLHMS